MNIVQFKRYFFVTLSVLFLNSVYMAQVGCENNIKRLDGAASEFKGSITEGGSERLILITQLGAKEQRIGLNERRLFAAKNYLISLGIEPDRIVTASAERSQGVRFGILEIYIAGKVFDTIGISTNQDLHVGSCEKFKEDQLFQMPKPKPRSKRPIKRKNR